MANHAPVNVLTLADDRYAMPLAVMVRSLLERYASPRPLRIKIIDGGISPENRRRLDRSWQGAAAGPVQWEFVPPSYRNSSTLPLWGRVPILTYSRLALTDYFDADEERTVLLDSDTLVLTSLDRLHDIALDGAVIGACVDPFIPSVSSIDGLAQWQSLGLAAGTPYFNAGVMVVDLRSWKKREVAGQAWAYIEREYRHLRQYDQDGLNIVLAGRWKQLDSRWQAHPRVRNSLGTHPPDDPWIVHFSGRLKPWLYRPNGPFDRLFFEFLARTEWREFRPRRSLAALGYALYDSPLRRVLYPVEVRALAWLRTIQIKRSGVVRA